MIDKNKMPIKQEIYSFRNQQSNIWLVRHIDKIFLIIITPITVFVALNFETNLIALFVFSLPYGFIYLFVRVQRRFAYEIEMDFSSKKILFKMHRSNEDITIKFDEVSGIHVNGYVIVKSTKKPIYYNELQDERIFYCLNKIKKIQFGPLSLLSGPSFQVKKELNAR